MPIRLASLYSCSLVRPFGRLVPERRPPRRPDDRSDRDVREDSLASPLRARSLLTVRAAISLARLVEAPRSFALSLTCSYWRSRLSLHACCGMGARSPPGGWLNAYSSSSSGLFCTLCSVAYASVSWLTTSKPSLYA